MNRRNFLKLIGLAPLAPSVLAAKAAPDPWNLKGPHCEDNQTLTELEISKMCDTSDTEGTGEFVYVNCDTSTPNGSTRIEVSMQDHKGVWRIVDGLEAVRLNDETYKIIIPEGLL